MPDGPWKHVVASTDGLDYQQPALEDVLNRLLRDGYEVRYILPREPHDGSDGYRTYRGFDVVAVKTNG